MGLSAGSSGPSLEKKRGEEEKTCIDMAVSILGVYKHEDINQQTLVGCLSTASTPFSAADGCQCWPLCPACHRGCRAVRDGAAELLLREQPTEEQEA